METNGETENDENLNSENGQSKVELENESKENNANDAIENDGNQNKQPVYIDDSQSNVRCILAELKEMYNQFLIQIKLVQNDLTRASRYDELESMVAI